MLLNMVVSLTCTAYHYLAFIEAELVRTTQTKVKVRNIMVVGAYFLFTDDSFLFANANFIFAYGNFVTADSNIMFMDGNFVSAYMNSMFAHGNFISAVANIFVEGAYFYVIRLFNFY